MITGYVIAIHRYAEPHLQVIGTFTTYEAAIAAQAEIEERLDRRYTATVVAVSADLYDAFMKVPS